MNVALEIKNAKSLMNEGKVAESKQLLLNLISSCKTGWGVLEYARLCTFSKDFDEGIEYCLQLLQNEKISDVYNVYAALGELYQAKSALPEASTYFKASFDFNKNLPNAVLPYLNFLFKNNFKDECISELKGIIESSESSDDICYHFIPKISSSKTNVSHSAWHQTSGYSDIDLNSVIVMLVKDEGDIIYHALTHHNKMGFKNFFIFNNNSSDETLKEIERARNSFSFGTTCVVIDDPYVQHIQGKKTTLLANFAVFYLDMIGVKVNWVFPLDADEFINSSNFSFFINSLSSDKKIIAFQMVNVSSDRVIDVINPFSIDFISAFSNVKKISTDSVSVKCAFRVSKGFEIMDGNHFIKGIVKDFDSIVFASDHNITLNHLPIRSVDQIRKKTINGNESAGQINVGQHWKDRYKMYKSIGELAFYRIVESFVNSK